MGTNVRRYLTGLVALAVALAVLLGLSPAAFAASLDNPPPGTKLWYRVDGRNLLIGAIKKLPDGRLAYCIDVYKRQPCGRGGVRCLGYHYSAIHRLEAPPFLPRTPRTAHPAGRNGSPHCARCR